MGHFRVQNGQKWPNLAIFGVPKLHVFARGFLIMGYPAAFFPIFYLPRAPKKRRKVAKNGHFLAKNGPFWAILGQFRPFLGQKLAKNWPIWPDLANFLARFGQKLADLASRLAGRVPGRLAGWSWGPPGTPRPAGWPAGPGGPSGAPI